MAKKKTINNESQTATDKPALTQVIKKIFASVPDVPMNYRQIAKKLDLKDDNSRKLINSILKELCGNKEIVEIYSGKYRYQHKGSYAIGKIEMTSGNNAFVNGDDIEERIFITNKNLNHALNGDTVKVYLFARRPERHLEGEVIEIVERGRKTFVGLVQISKTFAFLLPESKDIPVDVFIPLDKLNGAKDGMKAIARITEWPSTTKNPFGEILEVLGYPGDNETEMHSILAEYELPYKFPEDVEREAERIDDSISKQDYKNRRDFRNIPTFTIDPADAKDFDDALSYLEFPDGTIEVGVHIADVTHYVNEKSILDEEAYNRATSVYLVDRVVPMLPEKLSNNVCSLRPHEDKLCFSAVFKINKDAEVIEQWFGRTIIHSIKRFSYEEAQDIIESGEGELKNIILPLHQIAQTLRKNRLSTGAIAFDRAEVKFEIDKDGKPLRVFFKTNKESNQLIEEFMLLANRRVAEFIGKEGKESKKVKTFVYRIHDRPNEEKLNAFSNFIKKFGYKINTTSEKKIASSMNKLLHEVKGKDEMNVIENLAMRSMAKAIYTTQNIGHYGLAFEYYTHFTSPIRRYPDMMVHRLLAMYMENSPSQNKDHYESMCKHSTEMERKAMEAERASIKYKQVEFMSDKIGQNFPGVISGITEWGIYVELDENKCEGMVHIRELKGDYYIFDEDNYCIVGKRTGKKYQLGDKLIIEVYRTNLQKKQLDFRIYDPNRMEDFNDAFNFDKNKERSFKGGKKPSKNNNKFFGSSKGKKKR